jgi:hypothetical protein
MTFEAYCPYCEKTVTAMTVLGGDELKRALDGDAVVEAIHLPDAKPDHRWNLIEQEKRNLRKALG